jgi:hypothetical protein
MSDYQPCLTSLSAAERERIESKRMGRPLFVVERLAFAIADATGTGIEFDTIVTAAMDSLGIPPDMREDVSKQAMEIVNGWHDAALLALERWKPDGPAS